ncbi:tetratricopeptide repeat protein [Nocardiopsis alba]|uniref:tetratricopeptide repeat protein n=1 Tax=Nocardiopsis alba TaxID=53437 RepID=UPI003643249C
MLDGSSDRSVSNSMRDVHGGLVIQMRDQFGEIHLHQQRPDETVPLPPVHEWPRCGDTAPETVGVHPTRQGEGLPPLPPYVLRETDRELRARVRDAKRGGFVLVTGPSSVGKTRAAFEAVRAELPRHTFLAPAEDADLSGLPALAGSRRLRPGLVLWLDDLNRYLSRDSVNLSLLNRLIEARVTVVATINNKALKAQFDRVDGTSDTVRLLRAADPLPIGQVWTADEVDRISEAKDERLEAALTAQEGSARVAEYLVAGPQVLRDWRVAREPGDDGHPRGYALVAAALDLRKTGLWRPLSGELLEELHHLYLREDAESEPLEEAWRWVSELRYGVARLLVPDDTGPGLWDPYYYLLETAHRFDEEEIPEQVWEAAEGRLREVTDRISYGMRAVAHDRKEYCVRALRPLPVDELVRAAFIAGRRGYDGMTEVAFGLALDLDVGAAYYHFVLHQLDDGPTDERIDLLRTSAEHGNLDGMTMLAFYLLLRGRYEEARPWSREAAEGGAPTAMTLAALCADQEGDHEEAGKWYRAAAEAGGASQMHELGLHLLRHADREEAMGRLREASENGHTLATWALAELLLQDGDHDGAERLRQSVPEADRPELIVGIAEVLGPIMYSHERWDDAERLWRAAVEAAPDQPGPRVDLGRFLHERERYQEAIAELRGPAMKGDEDAMLFLSSCLEHTGSRFMGRGWSDLWFRSRYKRYHRRVRLHVLCACAAFLVPEAMLLGALTSQDTDPVRTPLLVAGLAVFLVVLTVPYLFRRGGFFLPRPVATLAAVGTSIVGLAPALILGPEAGAWLLLAVPVVPFALRAMSEHLIVDLGPVDDEEEGEKERDASPSE